VSCYGSSPLRWVTGLCNALHYSLFSHKSSKFKHFFLPLGLAAFWCGMFGMFKCAPRVLIPSQRMFNVYLKNHSVLRMLCLALAVNRYVRSLSLLSLDTFTSNTSLFFQTATTAATVQRYFGPFLSFLIDWGPQTGIRNSPRISNPIHGGSKFHAFHVQCGI
jgi:hypothetical protein